MTDRANDLQEIVDALLEEKQIPREAKLEMLITWKAMWEARMMTCPMMCDQLKIHQECVALLKEACEKLEGEENE